MKKFRMLSLLLIVVICTSLVACFSSYGRVKSTLETAGYTIIESDQKADDMQEESEIPVTPHVFKNINKLNVVIVFEFKATDEMIEFYKDSDTMQGLVKDIRDDGTAEEFYNELVDKGLANGNCLIISLNPYVAGEVADLMKNA